MASWRKTLKRSAVATAAGGTILAGGYGVASAAIAPGAHHGPRTLAGTVASVSAGSFTLTEHSGATRTVLTTSATRYRETGSPVAPSGVVAGEHVIVFLAGPARHWDPDSTSTSTSTSTTAAPAPVTPTAALVDIVLASERGVVQSVSGTTITLAGSHGTTRTVTVSGSTTYYEGGKATTASAVQPNVVVAAYGTRSSASGPLDATIVDVFPARPAATPPARDEGRPGADRDLDAPTTSTTASSSTTTDTTPATSPDRTSSPADRAGRSDPAEETSEPTTPPAAAWSRVGGTVASVSGDTITVNEPGPAGATATVTVTGSTRYFQDGRPASAASVAKGDLIMATGTRTATNALTAAVVDVHAPSPTPGTWAPEPRPGTSAPTTPTSGSTPATPTSGSTPPAVRDPQPAPGTPYGGSGPAPTGDRPGGSGSYQPGGSGGYQPGGSAGSWSTSGR